MGLADAPSVAAAAREHAALRAERVAAVLPVWRQQVEALPLEASAIAAKRRELGGLLIGLGDDSQREPFEAPIRAQEYRLRAAVVADRQRQRDVPRTTDDRQTTRIEPAPQREPRRVVPPLGGTQAFSTDRSAHEKTLRALHDGNFVDVAFNREDMTFATIFRGYLNAYAEHCTAYLPANPVEMTVPECNEVTVRKNGWGIEQGSHCSGWWDKPTGLWADSILYEAPRDTDRLIAGDTLKHLGRMLQGGDPIATGRAMIASAKEIKADMNGLVRMNACNGPGLKRFSENLGLFARNQPGLGAGGPATVSAVTVPVPGLPFRDQNYALLIEDLVTEQAATWVMNRFQPGSIAFVAVESRDSAGRPSALRATYSFQGVSRAARGTVTVTFNEGLPTCVFFADAPGTCRTADRRIAATYAAGGHEK